MVRARTAGTHPEFVRIDPRPDARRCSGLFTRLLFSSPTSHGFRAVREQPGSAEKIFDVFSQSGYKSHPVPAIDTVAAVEIAEVCAGFLEDQLQRRQIPGFACASNQSSA